MPETESRNSEDHGFWNHNMQGSLVKLFIQVEIEKRCYWKCWLSPSKEPNQQIKPHPTRWHYPLITYLISFSWLSLAATSICNFCKPAIIQWISYMCTVFIWLQAGIIYNIRLLVFSFSSIYLSILMVFCFVFSFSLQDFKF